MSTPNYEIDYNDKRLTQVETEKNQALVDVDSTYNDMRNQAKDFYQSQIDASKEWADKQQQLQQEKTDFTIEQIEQQKEQTNKDYIKEQSGAYVDWQKQSNQYGASAEQMAASGLTNTGYSESSKVSMYNTYQNRVAVAKEVHSQSILNYNNKIEEARLQNNSALAEIAYNAYIKQAELALQGFQYDNSLLQAQIEQKQATEDRYYNRYQDVLAQMNQENALAEEIRQYNEQMAYQKEQDARAYSQWQQEYALQQAQLAEQKRQYDANLAEEQRQFDLANSKTSSINKVTDSANKIANSLSSISKIFKSSNTNNGTTLKEAAASGLTTSYKGNGVTSRDSSAALSAAGANPLDCGNSASTKKKADYYFSNGYQPRYWDNEELNKTNATVSKVFGDTLEEYGIKGSQNVWYTKSNRMCVWDGSRRIYIDVTPEYKEWAKKAFG